MNFPGLNLGLSLMALFSSLLYAAQEQSLGIVCIPNFFLLDSIQARHHSLYTEQFSCSHCPEIPFAHPSFTPRVRSHSVLSVQHASNAEKEPRPQQRSLPTLLPTQPQAHTHRLSVSVNLPVGHLLCVSATWMRAREVRASLQVVVTR